MKTRSEAKAAKAKKVTEEPEPAPVPIPPPSEQILNDEESPFDFESANAAKESKLRPDMTKIVETVFVVDLHETWTRLRKALVIGEKRSDHGTLMLALDQAERNAHDAHRVYITSKIERERWERENDVILGSMWSEATRSLQKEKNDGLRAKQITDADIKARAATLHPDEYQAQEVRRASIKATVDSLENLSEQWSSRCRTLQTMLGKLRG